MTVTGRSEILKYMAGAPLLTTTLTPLGSECAVLNVLDDNL
jgi:hypothetical protein